MDTQTLSESLMNYMSAHPWLILLLIWIIVCKAFALWFAARRNEKIWFIALLIVNTVGILEIIYLAYVYLQNKKEQKNN